MDIDALIAPISEDAPCGQPDIDYDPRYAELERAAKGKQEQQMGDSVVAGEPPDWKVVSKLSQELLAQSKDLRLFMYLGRAQLNLEGIPAFAQVLKVIEQLMGEQWDNLYPELDSEDDNDPTLRVNSLLALRDTSGVIADVARSPLVSVKGVGTFSQHDIRVAHGELPGSSESPPIEMIEGAFKDAPIEGLQSLLEGIQQLRTTVSNIEVLLTEKVGAANSIDLSPLSDMLAEPERIVTEKLQKRGAVVQKGAEDDAAVESTGQAAVQVKTGINSRDDVVHTLQKICEYYELHEPSSPIPLLLRRAERLVHKSFMEIIKDITPDGVSNAETIAGDSGS